MFAILLVRYVRACLDGLGHDGRRWAHGIFIVKILSDYVPDLSIQLITTSLHGPSHKLFHHNSCRYLPPCGNTMLLCFKSHASH